MTAPTRPAKTVSLMGLTVVWCALTFLGLLTGASEVWVGVGIIVTNVWCAASIVTGR